MGIKVVFIGCQNIFHEIGNGGMQCSRRNYELLKNVEEIDLYTGIIVNEKVEKTEDSKIKYFLKTGTVVGNIIDTLNGRKNYSYAVEKEILQYIKQIEPAILYLDSSTLGKILNKVPEDIYTICFFHNIETDYSYNKIKTEGMAYYLPYLISRYNEKIVCRKANKVICLNKRDGNRLQQLYNRRPDLYLPISFRDRFNKNRVHRKSNDKTLLFIGSLFPPNYYGILWFVQEVMSKLSDYKLIIVGKDFEKKRNELARRNVEIIGTVKDLDEYYYTYSNIVMPIQYGAGMKVKTAEAMMFGMTIFATNEALEGYDVIGIKGITRCNSAEEYITAINNYFSNEEQLRYQSDVRELFSEKYETSSVKNKFGQFMDRIMDSTS